MRALGGQVRKAGSGASSLHFGKDYLRSIQHAEGNGPSGVKTIKCDARAEEDGAKARLAHLRSSAVSGTPKEERFDHAAYVRNILRHVKRGDNYANALWITQAVWLL